MIVFIPDTDLKKALRDSGEYDTFVILGEPDQFPKHEYVTGIQFVPPPDALYQLIDKGDKEGFVKNYLNYLTDPRVSYMILASVINAIEERTNVFFVYTKDDKENYGNFPKYLRLFMANSLRIDPDFITTYKKWNGKAGKVSKADRVATVNLCLQMSRKAKEAMEVYGEL